MTDTTAALKSAEAELIEARTHYAEARERGARLAQRRREADQRRTEAEQDLARVKALSDAAFDAHVAGEVDYQQFEKRLAAVTRAEKARDAARDTAERFAQMENREHALSAAHHRVRDAEAVYAAAVATAELGTCPDLRAHLMTAFVAWSWGNRTDLAEVGSERGALLHRFLVEHFDAAGREEIEGAMERFQAAYLDPLEPPE
jgi:multidrug efflux pump subunit AcrA (membrane-fusion protein)